MKVHLKYIKGITNIDTSFDCETINDCARGILNLLYGYSINDLAMDDATIELLSNPKYYKNPEDVGTLKAYILIVADRYENLKYIVIDDEVILDR